jgi:undecaprenyl-diphosphatase
METRLLLTVHAQAGPWLDGFFALSHQVGTYWFCVVLVLVVALAHGLRRQATLARIWIVVGLSTLVLQEGLKRLFLRPRPELWPRLATWPPLASSASFAFPSGHALASATFYPLLAYVLTRRSSPGVRRAALAAGIAVALWIGLGRLYLGVHWPSDVVAGWALGALQAFLAIQRVRRQELVPPRAD